MIDSSIAGLLTKDVSGSSNVALNFTNGSPNETDNAIFIITGTLTGNVDVLLPNGKTKLFMVKNSTSGAFSLSLGVNSTGSPGTPAGTVASVPAGATAMIYSDGTNASNALTGFYDLTVTDMLTGPDGGTWTSAGIKTTGLGIGFSGSLSTIVDVRSNANTSIVSRVFSSSSGTSAQAEFTAQNDSNVPVSLGICSSGYSSAGMFTAGSAFLASNSSGLNIGFPTGVGGVLSWYTNGTLLGTFAGDGGLTWGNSGIASLGFGSIHTQGQIKSDGNISAVGTITQSVSDDRLKNRNGHIRGALLKVLSLSAFYYQFNDLAHQLGIDDGQRHVGLSAQQMKRVLPEVVAVAPINSAAKDKGISISSDFLTIQYEQVVPLLVQAIKTLAVICGVSVVVSMACLAMLIWR